ncbi:MAG TPA: hypothetical protein ENK06_14650 [Gammaproteobacteria bacterium]|nr:hypothetical protein [Gammaproteobacteria bacterium]
MRIATILLTLLMTNTAIAGSFEGKYRPNKNWNCRDVGVDGGALAIRGNKLHGVENVCTMTNPTRVRDMDATLYDLDCWGEGEKWKSRIMLMKTDGGLLHIGNGYASKWFRCPR